MITELKFFESLKSPAKQLVYEGGRKVIAICCSSIRFVVNFLIFVPVISLAIY